MENSELYKVLEKYKGLSFKERLAFFEKDKPVLYEICTNIVMNGGKLNRQQLLQDIFAAKDHYDKIIASYLLKVMFNSVRHRNIERKENPRNVCHVDNVGNFAIPQKTNEYYYYANGRRDFLIGSSIVVSMVVTQGVLEKKIKAGKQSIQIPSILDDSEINEIFEK